LNTKNGFYLGIIKGSEDQKSRSFVLTPLVHAFEWYAGLPPPEMGTYSGLIITLHTVSVHYNSDIRGNLQKLLGSCWNPRLSTGSMSRGTQGRRSHRLAASYAVWPFLTTCPAVCYFLLGLLTILLLLLLQLLGINKDARGHPVRQPTWLPNNLLSSHLLSHACSAYPKPGLIQHLVICSA
jgi:hypothetical protein